MGTLGEELAKVAAKELTEKLNNTVGRKLTKKVSLPVNIGFIGSVALSAFLARSAYEKDHPEYARYDIDGAGKAGDNVRLVFLTDLHEKEFGKGNKHLLAMIDKADPDAVLIGGDMVIADKSHPGYYEDRVTCSLCGELAKKYPVFYAEGNHEQRVIDENFRNRLEEAGVTYLDNETVDWKYNLSFTGISLDDDQYRPVSPKKPDKGVLDIKAGKRNPERFNILLAHSPLFLKEYASTGADLVLSGHFHGGTIRLPGKVGLMTPQYQFFNTDVVGLKHFNHTFMIISSGLGTHSINLRINNKPQVVVVDIKK